ncbi:DUF1476 domain-containing protein [Oceanicola sp. S124]|uniref:DUF1476 domain-containing protein n=1 Tax=Oceanicola sp. S124 TaxID=1042378 RepID=UPI00025585CB|nr:DUF1476 domain-containing protein [Oceanicola sp. S124]
MSNLKDREAAFESKFAHDSEMQFRAEARCNRALGHWAAGLLGLEGEAAEAYAVSLVKADLAEPGHEDVISKLVADLQGHADEATIRARHAQTLTEAKAALAEA